MLVSDSIKRNKCLYYSREICIIWSALNNKTPYYHKCWVVVFTFMVDFRWFIGKSYGFIVYSRETLSLNCFSFVGYLTKEVLLPPTIGVICSTNLRSEISVISLEKTQWKFMVISIYKTIKNFQSIQNWRRYTSQLHAGSGI